MIEKSRLFGRLFCFPRASRSGFGGSQRLPRGPAARLKLREQMPDMALDRLLGEEEPDADLAVDETVRDQLEHLDLAGGRFLLQLLEGRLERDDLRPRRRRAGRRPTRSARGAPGSGSGSRCAGQRPRIRLSARSEAPLGRIHPNRVTRRPLATSPGQCRRWRADRNRERRSTARPRGRRAARARPSSPATSRPCEEETAARSRARGRGRRAPARPRSPPARGPVPGRT